MLEPILAPLNNLRIVLASSSQQRAKLLENIKLKFEVVPSDFEENLDATKMSHSAFVQATAEGKVLDVRDKLSKDMSAKNADVLIIGADTMVAHNGLIYGKPKSKEDAIHVVKQLTQSEIPHQVYTAVVISYRNKIYKFTEVTMVHMVKLTDEEIQCYVDTGEPMGKAGAYAIQGIAGSFVKSIDGNASNVIGLPICKLIQVLKQILSDKNS